MKELAATTTSAADSAVSQISSKYIHCEWFYANAAFSFGYVSHEDCLEEQIYGFYSLKWLLRMYIRGDWINQFGNAALSSSMIHHINTAWQWYMQKYCRHKHFETSVNNCGDCLTRTIIRILMTYHWFTLRIKLFVSNDVKYSVQSQRNVRELNICCSDGIQFSTLSPSDIWCRRWHSTSNLYVRVKPNSMPLNFHEKWSIVFILNENKPLRS